MRMERGNDAVGPVVRGFGAGGFKVDDASGKGGVYPALLLTPVRADNWSPPPLAILNAADLAAILTPAPEFVLLGTGAILSHPPRALIAELEALGVGVETMDSRAAARAWSVLRSEGRPIAAALYPLND